MSESLSQSWNEYRKLVIQELEYLKESLDETITKIGEIEKERGNDEAAIRKLINDEINDLKSKLSIKIDGNKDDILERAHKLDIRLNTLETKVYMISSLVGGAVGTLVTLGKVAIEAWLK
jgi:hypothetical protein